MGIRSPGELSRDAAKLRSKKRYDYEVTLSLDLTGLDSFLSRSDMSMISKNANNVLHAQIVRNYNFPP